MWKRVNHDLHNTLGLYAFIFLFLMGITGSQWSFEWYRTGLQKALGTYEAPTLDGGRSRASGRNPKANRKKEKKNEELKLLPIEKYILSANNELLYPGDYRISIPASHSEPLTISKSKVGFFAPAASYQLKIDVNDASLIEKSIFTDKPLNERISTSIKAIHLGNVYGSFTKLLYFFACLIATTLPVTGTLFRLNKMKKTPRNKKKTIKTKQQHAITN